MDREKEEFWSAVLKEQNTSRQTIKSFCEDYGIAVWQFYYWKKKLSSGAGSPAGFSELKLSSTNSESIRLLAGSIEIFLDHDFDPDFLKKVLRVLNC